MALGTMPGPEVRLPMIFPFTTVAEAVDSADPYLRDGPVVIEVSGEPPELVVVALYCCCMRCREEG